MMKKIYQYFGSYGFNSIILRNALKIFIIFVIITMIPTTIAYIYAINSVKNEVIALNREEAQRTSIAIENIFRDSEYLAAAINADIKVELFMSMGKDSVISKELEKDLVLTLNAYSIAHSDINMVYLYNENKNCIVTLEGIKKTEEYTDITELVNCDESFINGHKVLLKENEEHVIKGFLIVNKSANRKGFVAVEVKRNNIRKRIVESIQSTSEFYIVQGNEIIYSSTYNKDKHIPEWFDSEKNGYLKNKNIVYHTIDSEYYDISYVLSGSIDSHTNEFRHIYIIFISVILTVIIVVLIISFLLGMSNMGYITSFIEIIENKKKIHNLKNDEINYVSEQIISIIDDNERLKKDIEERIAEYSNMKQKALQSQLTPHFINNTIVAIGGKVVEECGLDSVSLIMLSRFSKLIRYSYMDSNIFVKVKEELEYIKNYIDIMLLRYDSFQVQFDIDESLLDEKILKMILQPFVENAIFYGLTQRGDTLKISISDCGEDSILISVYDNGEGIDEENIQRIMANINKEEFIKENIGIRNVYKRLKLVYGDRFQFEIESEFHKFTEIRIWIAK